MMFEPGMFTSGITHVQTSLVRTANNSKLNVSHIADISVANVTLSDAFLVPKLTLNLISIRKLCELGYKVNFSDRGHVVQDAQTGWIIWTSYRVGCLFKLVPLIVLLRAPACCGLVISPETWHFPTWSCL